MIEPVKSKYNYVRNKANFLRVSDTVEISWKLEPTSEPIIQHHPRYNMPHIEHSDLVGT